MFFGEQKNKRKHSTDVEKECPACHHKEAEHHIQGTNNGVMGSGYHFHKTDEFYSCKKCGVRFNDVKKN